MNEIIIRKYSIDDIDAMAQIWNEVVMQANAFPQFETLSDNAAEFFSSQSYCGVAEENGTILGMYILHPNNVGRCGHICNASYAVRDGLRGKGIGRLLVEDCLAQGRKLGFRILQFNAVVASNTGAIKLYEKLGFEKIGTVEGGYLNGKNEYEDIILYYHKL